MSSLHTALKILASSFRPLGLVASRRVSTAKLFINGKFMESEATEWTDVRDPATNELLSKAPRATMAEMVTAVNAAKEAFQDWSKTSVQRRQQILFKYHSLLKENARELAKMITLEQGKTLRDAEGEVQKGVLYVENSLCAAHLLASIYSSTLF